MQQVQGLLLAIIDSRSMQDEIDLAQGKPYRFFELIEPRA
jgi:hypothetical protein